AFSVNTASDSGGGIYNTGTATLQQWTLAGNSATDGGGIFNAASGTLWVKDSTVTGNSATLGGDLYNAGLVIAPPGPTTKTRSSGPYGTGWCIMNGSGMNT